MRGRFSRSACHLGTPALNVFLTSELLCQTPAVLPSKLLRPSYTFPSRSRDLTIEECFASIPVFLPAHGPIFPSLAKSCLGTKATTARVQTLEPKALYPERDRASILRVGCGRMQIRFLILGASQQEALITYSRGS